MRAEYHYDDESLIALLESGDDISRDPHLSACDTCSEVAASLRQIAGALTHDDVWDSREFDETPDRETVAFLRGYADEMTREDALASEHLSSVLAGSRESWLGNLESHPEYRTAGMVRALIAATDRAIDTMPPDAVAMTEVATAIADAIPPSAYATDTVLKLRGAAWRERAYALFYVGRYPEAEVAITTAEKHFGQCVVNEYDLGRADIVHALVYGALDRDRDSMRHASKAVDRFRDSGDIQRYVSSVTVKALGHIKVLDYRGALSLLTDANRRFAMHVSPDMQARLLTNSAVCQRALGQFVEAIESYRAATMIFEEMGVRTDAARIRANIAVLLRDRGDLRTAAAEMHRARAAFEELGMAWDVALTGLDLAEIALADGAYDEVESLCRKSIEYFEAAGVPYGPRAMTALSYVTEAVRQRRLTPEIVGEVQRYIRRLPAQPTLLFALPPD